MRKKEFIQNLNRCLFEGDLAWKGQRSFATFLVDYLTRLDLSNHEKYDFWNIDPYVPQILLDAMEELRTGTEPYVVEHRGLYEQETGKKVPNIADTGESSSLVQCGVVQTTLGFLMSKVMSRWYRSQGIEDGHWIEPAIDTYCNAQRHVIQQYFDKFIRTVYRKGMYDIIKNTDQRGLGGKFGTTRLRAFSCVGRLMFTFARKKGKGEIDVSFVGEDGDSLLYSSGLQSVNANFIECLSMITDVIDNWPKEPEKQKRVFKPKGSVTLDVVAAMNAVTRKKEGRA